MACAIPDCIEILDSIPNRLVMAPSGGQPFLKFIIEISGEIAGERPFDQVVIDVTSSSGFWYKQGFDDLNKLNTSSCINFSLPKKFRELSILEEFVVRRSILYQSACDKLAIRALGQLRP